MIKLICGPKGTGKTKKMIQLANDSMKTVKGKVFFLEVNNKHIFELNHDIKYINSKEYGINNADEFLGFAKGILAADYDIEKVYIDGIYKIAKIDVKDLEKIVNVLEKSSEKFEAQFIMSVDFEADKLPENVKKYLFDM